MTRKEFKNYLDKNKISYYHYKKWLIIDDNNADVDILNIKVLPDYLVFDNKGNVDFMNSKIEELPKNILFSENVSDIYIYDEIKLKYYNIYFNKVYILNIQELNDNLVFEKLSLKYCFNVFPNIMPKYSKYSNPQYNKIITPHICHINSLKFPKYKEYININLPKNFLSMTSWI